MSRPGWGGPGGYSVNMACGSLQKYILKVEDQNIEPETLHVNSKQKSWKSLCWLGIVCIAGAKSLAEQLEH